MNLLTVASFRNNVVFFANDLIPGVACRTKLKIQVRRPRLEREARFRNGIPHRVGGCIHYTTPAASVLRPRSFSEPKSMLLNQRPDVLVIVQDAFAAIVDSEIGRAHV